MYRKCMSIKVCNEEEQKTRCFEILIICSNWEILGQSCPTLWHPDLKYKYTLKQAQPWLNKVFSGYHSSCDDFITYYVNFCLIQIFM